MKTTKAQFEYFKKRCEYWRVKFQMGNWDFGYWHEKCEDVKAEYKIKGGGRVATIWFATEWDDDITFLKIDRTAFHEVFEILLHELRLLALHYYAYAEVDERTHMIVRVMENVVFPIMRNK
jgi:hypothetical protein